MVIAESGQKAREIRGGLRRGGERRPPYGPALGGEAGAVLIMKLIRKRGRDLPPGVVSTTPWRNTPVALMRLQPIELQHMPGRLRRSMSRSLPDSKIFFPPYH